jgi:Fe-S cluster biogenesis protein NfuA
MTRDPLVEFIVTDMSNVALRADGGHAELLDVTGDGVAVVTFEPGQNDECATCAMTAEDFLALLLDEIKRRVPRIRELRVADPERASRAD